TVIDRLAGGAKIAPLERLSGRQLSGDAGSSINPEGASSKRRRGLAGLAVLVEPPGDEHRHLEGLLVVQPGIDPGAVVPAQVVLVEAAGAADALGDVLPRELEVDATQGRAEPGVDVERGGQFAEDAIEPPGLDAARQGLGVAVHRVGHPEDPATSPPERLDEWGQALLDGQSAH